MSPKMILLNRFVVGAIMTLFAQHAFTAVLILDGSAPPPSPAPPPAVSAPSAAAPQEELPPPTPSNPTLPPSPGDSGIPNPGTGPAAVAIPETTIPPSPSTLSADIGTAKVSNSAEVSVEMMPGQTVSVGSQVSFRVTSKKAGYLVLVDVDATGHLTQIYPNTASLTRTNRPNGNYIKPGGTLAIPLATDPYAGVQYVVSPPNGQAMIVAILSAQPVQILDLPDVPPEIKDKSDMLVFLSKWTDKLRIPDDSSQLRETSWSLNAKTYTIQ
jgi:hypothetical protein